MNDFSTIKELIPSTENLKSMIITLAILISVNILLEVLKLIASIVLSNKDKSNKRQLLIEEKRIKVLEVLFKKLDSLTLLDKSENETLLNELKEISIYVSQNKLYISEPIEKITTKIMD